MDTPNECLPARLNLQLFNPNYLRVATLKSVVCLERIVESPLKARGRSREHHNATVTASGTQTAHYVSAGSVKASRIDGQ